MTTEQIITGKVKLITDLLSDYKHVKIFSAVFNEGYTPEKYGRFLKDLASNISTAGIFIKLATDKKYDTLFKDLVENYPEIISVLAWYYQEQDFNKFFEKLSSFIASHESLSQADYYLFPLKKAIKKLENKNIEPAYANYYTTLKHEMEKELEKGKDMDSPKISHYRLIGIKYFELAKILLSEADKEIKYTAIYEAYQFSTPSWMSLPLKIAAMSLITALGALAGFVLGGIATGGIASVPAAMKGAMFAATWSTKVIIGTSLTAATAAGLSVYGLFGKNAFEKASANLHDSLQNYIKTQSMM